MKYFENKYTKLQERKKNIIQALASLATNANLKGFLREGYIREIQKWHVFRD